MTATRRLVAIFYADVAGYSRLTGADEEGTHRRVMALLDEVTARIGAAGGEVLRYAGDAILAVFPSVVLAVDTSAAIQTAIAERNAGLPQDERVEIRIGINLGDVIEDRGEVYGKGVNLAARLEAAAEPGGLCVSAAVHEQCRRKTALTFRDGGERAFKNIEGAVRVYTWAPGALAELASPDDGPLPLPKKPSIAVLPFSNMSGDPEQEYFSDGITEDIITALSRSPWLFIIARNTTFTYKGRSVDVRRVAEELGVRFVLEGSVRRAGDRVRVTAQLIDGSSGGHVWSERYDGRVEDVFDLQDEITRQVVASIQTTVHLSTIEEPVERQSRPDLTVWELTMRAWHLLYDFSPEAFAAAKTLLERALALDPSSAEANLVLSLINHHAASMGYAPDTRQAMEAAYALGRRATQLDDRNEYAHWALGISCWGINRHDEGVAALERAVELNPNCSLAYGSLGTALALVGRTGEAISNQLIAIRMNPRDPSIFFRFSGLAMANYVAGDYSAAVEWAERAVRRMPRWYLGHFLLAASHAALGQLDQARAAVAACTEVLPEAAAADIERVPLTDAARMQQLRSHLAEAGFR